MGTSGLHLNFLESKSRHAAQTGRPGKAGGRSNKHTSVYRQVGNTPYAEGRPSLLQPRRAEASPYASGERPAPPEGAAPLSQRRKGMSAGGRSGRGADANRHNRAPPATPSPLTGPQPEVTHGGYAGLPARPAATTGSAICGASGPCGASSPEPLGSVLRKRARCAGTTLRLHPLASAPGFPDRGLRLLRRGRRGPPIPSDAQRWAEAEPGGVKALGKRVSSGTPPGLGPAGQGSPGTRSRGRRVGGSCQGPARPVPLPPHRRRGFLPKLGNAMTTPKSKVQAEL